MQVLRNLLCESAVACVKRLVARLIRPVLYNGGWYAESETSKGQGAGDRTAKANC